MFCVDGIIDFPLTEITADESHSHWEPEHSADGLESVVNHVPLDEEVLEAAVHEVEQPLLCGIRSVVPDVPATVTSGLETRMLGGKHRIHEFRYSQSLAVDKFLVLDVAHLIMS